MSTSNCKDTTVSLVIHSHIWPLFCWKSRKETNPKQISLQFLKFQLIHIDTCSIALYNQKGFGLNSSVLYLCIHMCTTVHTTSNEVSPAPHLPQAEAVQCSPHLLRCPVQCHGSPPLDSLQYVRISPARSSSWAIRAVLPMPNNRSESFLLVVQPQAQRLFNYLGSLLLSW